MARHPKGTAATDEDGGEMHVITPGDPSAAPEVKLEAPGDALMKGSALDRNPVSAADAQQKAPKLKRYRVVRGGMYADPHTRARTMIKVGKEIDNRNYDPRDLHRQGIGLEPIDDDE